MRKGTTLTTQDVWMKDNKITSIKARIVADKNDLVLDGGANPVPLYQYLIGETADEKYGGGEITHNEFNMQERLKMSQRLKCVYCGSGKIT